MHVQSTSIIMHANASKLATHYQAKRQRKSPSATALMAMAQSPQLKEIWINP